MTDPVACAPSPKKKWSLTIRFSTPHHHHQCFFILSSFEKKEVLTVLQSSDIRILGLKFGRKGGVCEIVGKLKSGNSV